MAKIDELDKQIRTKLNKTIRTATKSLMNGLAESGPVWSGDFRDSYIAQDVSTGKFINAKFPYTLRDVPRLPITLKEINRTKRLVIGNTAPHAKIAMDLVAGDFTVPKGIRHPEGDIVARGSRPEGGRRGEIGPREAGRDGDNRSTAPLDWYKTFVDGGKLQKIMQKEISTTFTGEV